MLIPKKKYMDAVFYFDGESNTILIDGLKFGGFQGFYFSYCFLVVNTESKIQVFNVKQNYIILNITKSFLKSLQLKPKNTLSIQVEYITLKVGAFIYLEGVFVLEGSTIFKLSESKFSVSKHFFASLLKSEAQLQNELSHEVNLQKTTIFSFSEPSNSVFSLASLNSDFLLFLQEHVKLIIFKCNFAFYSSVLSSAFGVDNPSKIIILKSVFQNIFIDEAQVGSRKNSLFYVTFNSQLTNFEGILASDNIFLNIKLTIITVLSRVILEFDENIEFQRNIFVNNKWKYMFALNENISSDGLGASPKFYILPSKNKQFFSNSTTQVLWFTNIMDKEFIARQNNILSQNYCCPGFAARSPVYAISLIRQLKLDFIDEVLERDKKLSIITAREDYNLRVENKKIIDDCYFYIVPFDFLGNALFDELSDGEIQKYMKSDLVVVNYKTSRGLFCAKNITLLTGYQPRQTIEIHYMFKTNFLNQNQISPLQGDWRVYIDFLDCQEGQVLDSVTLQCRSCPRGTYSKTKVFNDLNSECNYCYSNFDFYCYGGDKISPKPGYWRGVNNSLSILKCPGDSCLGDIYFETKNDNLELKGILSKLISQDPDTDTEAYSKGVCLIGHSGVMCTICEEEYGSAGNFKCAPCSDWYNYLKFSLLITIKTILFLLSTIKILNINKSLINYKENDLPVTQSMKSSALISIFTYHFQILSVIRFLPIQLSLYIKEIFSIGVQSLSQNLDQIFSQECLLKNIGAHQYIPTQYSVLVGLILFDLTCYFFVFFYWFRTLNKETNSKINFFETFNKTGTIILLYMIIVNQPGQVQPFVNQFVCVDVLEPNNISKSTYVSRLFLEMNIKCNENTHILIKMVFALPLIICLVLVLPLYLLIHLMLYKNELDQPKTLLRYGFLYIGFRKKAMYYYMTTFVEHAILIAFQTAFLLSGVDSDKIHRKLTLSFLIFIFSSYLLFVTLKPYKRQYYLITKITYYSKLVLILTFFLALLWMCDQEANSFAWGFIIFAIIIFFNCVFFFIILFQYSKFLKEKILRYKRRIKTFFEKTRSLIRNSFRANKRIDDFFETLTSIMSSQRKSVKTGILEAESDNRADKLLQMLNAKLNSKKQKKREWKAKCMLLSRQLEILYKGTKASQGSLHIASVLTDQTNDQAFKPYEQFEAEIPELEIDMNEKTEKQEDQVDIIEIDTSHKNMSRRIFTPAIFGEARASPSNLEIVITNKFQGIVANKKEQVYSESSGRINFKLISKNLIGESFKDYYVKLLIRIGLDENHDEEISPIISSIKISKQKTSKNYAFHLISPEFNSIHNLKDPLEVEIWSRLIFNPMNFEDFSEFNDPYIGLKFNLGSKPDRAQLLLPLKISDFCIVEWEPCNVQKLRKQDYDSIMANDHCKIRELLFYPAQLNETLGIAEKSLQNFSALMRFKSPIIDGPSIAFSYVMFEQRRLLSFANRNINKKHFQLVLKIFDQVFSK